jgi:hypothetical protein
VARPAKIGRWIIAAGLLTVAIALLLQLVFRAREKAESLNCASTVVSICFAARLWADDHGDKLPASFAAMSNELVSPKILHCPSDHTRPRASTWNEFSTQHLSYELLKPGMSTVETNSPWLRCRVHGHLGYTDFTVFDGARRRGKFP